MIKIINWIVFEHTVVNLKIIALCSDENVVTSILCLSCPREEIIDILLLSIAV